MSQINEITDHYRYILQGNLQNKFDIYYIFFGVDERTSNAKI